MSKAKILIVDDEEDVCRMIKDRLVSLDYDAHYVLNGPDALEYAKKEHPDLIILDILMPGMDGYEVSKRLIDSKGVSTIPIIMLTALSSQQNKLKALTMGIDDYITKPFDFEELVARMESVLRRWRREGGKKKSEKEVSKVANAVLSPEDHKRMELLKVMFDKKIPKLEPVYNINSPTGYEYPLAAQIFESVNGAEVAQLEVLAERQCFYKEFFDRVLLCPFCKNYNLNIREDCPSCKSSNLKVVGMIHHYRCAYTGIEDEFKQGIDYVCPKCHRELKNIGVDYDKPGQNYLCEACKTLSTEVETRGQCRSCKQIFSIENAVRQTIFSYVITQKASVVIEEGVFLEVADDNAWIDEQTDVYNVRYLRSVLSQEFKQAQHFKRNLSLILLTIDNYHSIEKIKGEVVALKIIKKMTEIFKESIRPIDLPARFQENTLIAMLVECDKKNAVEIVKTMRSKIDRAMEKDSELLSISFRAVSFPADAKDEDSLLKKLLESDPL